MPRPLLLLVFLLGAGCRCPNKPDAVPEKFRKIDVHTHFSSDAAQGTVALMDARGIEAVVNLSGGAPGEGLEEELAAAAQHPGRIVVFANLDWNEARRGPGYGQRLAGQLARARALGAKGLKISKALGLGYRGPNGELLKVDDPGLDPLFEAAGALGMPVAIHAGDPVAFWLAPTPDNERYDELSVHPGWSYFGKKVPPWEELFSALERRIARHPKTPFISVHFGNAPEDPARVAAQLDRFPNLYLDTAARVPEIGRYPAAKMRALFIAHQDRILFGTDLGIGAQPSQLMLGSTGAEPPTPADVER
ncbi:MAG: amidohydrolase family protein, partial [Myxococcaceae bacterium]